MDHLHDGEEPVTYREADKESGGERASAATYLCTRETRTALNFSYCCVTKPQITVVHRTQILVLLH